MMSNQKLNIYSIYFNTKELYHKFDHLKHFFCTTIHKIGYLSHVYIKIVLSSELKTRYIIFLLCKQD